MGFREHQITPRRSTGMSQRRRIDDCQGERKEAGDNTVAQFSKRAANDIDETEALYRAHVAEAAANSARQRVFAAQCSSSLSERFFLGSRWPQQCCSKGSRWRGGWR